MSRWSPDVRVATEELLQREHLDFVDALRGEAAAETTGEDNLNTVRLACAAYESARNDQLVRRPSA